jgi:nitrogen fixation protein NifZ
VRPKYDYGTQVRVLRSLRNDGTFPGLPTGALLVRRGSLGFVRDLGTFLQDQLVYSVHFLDPDRLVGCREEALQPAEAPWVPSLFEPRDRVTPRVSLAVRGEVVARPGDTGEVLKVLRDAPGGVICQVHFAGRVLELAETLLTPAAAPGGGS